MTQYALVTACHDCGLLQQINHMPEDGTVKCYRCNATLRQQQRIETAKNIEYTLAFVITALVLLMLANAYPVAQVGVEGHETAVTLFACVKYLFNNEMQILATLVFLTTIGIPFIQLAGLLYILLPVNFNRIPPFAAQIYRLVCLITPWGMLEVLMLSILVSVVKLSALFTVVLGVALWAFVLLIVFITVILYALDKEILWQQISPKIRLIRMQKIKRDTQLTNCRNCNLLCIVSTIHKTCCPRCNVAVHLRKPQSLTHCTALVIVAAVLYIPANLLPVIVITKLGKTESDTIISGVIYLATTGDMPLAMILFIASICIPIIKLVILTLLLITVYFKLSWRPKERTRLYHLSKFIGRWSMVDIFVDVLLATLIQIQGLMVMEVGVGAIYFATVVVLTMLAVMAFDPRLIWDNMQK